MKSFKAVWGWLIIGLALVSQRSLALYATYNYKGGVQAGDASGLAEKAGLFTRAEVKLNFAAIAADRVAKGLAALAAADILEVFPVKAGTWVQMVAAEVTTVEGETATIGVGDGGATSGFISAGDANATGWLSSLITTTFSVATAGGKIYTVDDTIDVLLNTAAFNLAVITLHVVAVDLRKYRS